MSNFKYFITKYKSENKHMRTFLQKFRGKVTRKLLERLMMKAP